MSMRCVVGNLLDDASAVTMTPAADPLFPVEFAHDGPGQSGARFGALAAESEVRVSFASVIPFADGFEDGAASGDAIAVTWNEPDIETDWTIEQGLPASPTQFSLLQVFDSTLTSVGVDHGGNDFNLRLLPGPSDVATAILTRTRTCRAGATYLVNGWVVNDLASTAGAAIRVFNPLSGLYLQTDGTWGAAADLVKDSTFDQVWLGINAGAGVTFTMPDADELGAQSVEVELQLLAADDQGAMFDDLVFQSLPPADFIGIFGGHNIQAAAEPILWQTSDDGESWTTRATLVRARHQFWTLLAAPVTASYHRILFSGTPTLKMWMGDVVLGLAQTLSKGPFEPIPISFPWVGQVRQATPAGSRRISNRAPAPARRLTMNFRYASAAQEAEALDLWIDQVQGGEKSVVVLPSVESAGPKVPVFPKLAIYGDIGGEADLSVSLHGQRQPSDPGGELGGEFGTQDHYSDMTVIVEEGAEFEIL